MEVEAGDEIVGVPGDESWETGRCAVEDEDEGTNSVGNPAGGATPER